MDLGDEIELATYVDGDREPALVAAIPGARSSPVEAGWEDRWRSFHRPVRTGGLWIGPPWEHPSAGEPVVVVDPGRAFGTGAHPSTRASIELLAGLPRGSVLDAGCGSGVVAVAAAKLGFDPIVAVDVDPVAVDAARANAERNDVSFEVRLLDVLSAPLPAADILVANLDHAAVERLLARSRSTRAVVSGYLARDVLQLPEWRRVGRVQLTGWAADSLVRA